jgi:hypothetical protein
MDREIIVFFYLYMDSIVQQCGNSISLIWVNKPSYPNQLRWESGNITYFHVIVAT